MHFGLKWIVAATIISLAVVGVGAMQATSRPRIDYQKAAETSGWTWRAERANPLWCILNYRGPYGIELVSEAGKYQGWALSVRFVRDGSTVFTWNGHYRTVFILTGDDLYVAEFSPIACGCSIVAIDLPEGRERWRTRLQGAGLVSHSAYANYINLVESDECIIVYGNEGAGQYIEFVDLKTGKTVGHHVIAKGATNKKQ